MYSQPLLNEHVCLATFCCSNNLRVSDYQIPGNLCKLVSHKDPSLISAIRHAKSVDNESSHDIS